MNSTKTIYEWAGSIFWWEINKIHQGYKSAINYYRNYYRNQNDCLTLGNKSVGDSCSFNVILLLHSIVVRMLLCNMHLIIVKIVELLARAYLTSSGLRPMDQALCLCVRGNLYLSYESFVIRWIWLLVSSWTHQCWYLIRWSNWMFKTHQKPKSPNKAWGLMCKIGCLSRLLWLFFRKMLNVCIIIII